MENKINEWLDTLSSRFGEKEWKLDNYQCCLNDSSGLTYLIMEWLPDSNLLLLAFPLGSLDSSGFTSEEKMFQLLSLNSHTELVGKAWIAVGDDSNEYYLMSTIDVAITDYDKFEQHWLEVNDLPKLIQFAITSKIPVMDVNVTEQSVRV